MTNKNIYFSIIIPCFNASKYIDRCIKSIFKQTYKNYEVILVDDCSSDETFKILNKYFGIKIDNLLVDLIEKMTDLNYKTRLNIKQILKHKYFSK